MCRISPQFGNRFYTSTAGTFYRIMLEQRSEYVCELLSTDRTRTSSSLHHAGCAALLLLLRQRGIIHLSNDLCKQLVHHGLALGRRLDERASPLLGQSSPVRSGDLALGLQVDFVPNQDQWHLLKAFHSHYLVSHWSNVLKNEKRERSMNVVSPGKKKTENDTISVS